MQYWINLIGVPYDHLFAIAAEAEQLGFTGLALADHLAVPTVIESPYPGGARPWTETDDWPDVWVMIGAMAAVTSRLRFVTNVYVEYGRPFRIVSGCENVTLKRASWMTIAARGVASRAGSGAARHPGRRPD